MQDFMKKWKTFQTGQGDGRQVLSESKVVTKRRKVLSEISSFQMDQIGEFLGELEPGQLSFEELFEGKRRIMFPFDEPSESNDDTPFGKMLALFDAAGATPDFTDSTISQEVKSDRSDKIQVRKTRIGKWLNKAVSAREREAKARDVYYTASDNANGDAEAFAIADKFSEIREKNQKDFGQHFSMYSPSVLKDMAKFWATKSEYYRQNPEAAKGETNKYSVIVSRAPIDILRMSDFQNIQSCHSPEAGYFQCAIAEAKGHGLVAFVVENEQWNFAAENTGIDLQDDEIFTDVSRNFKGISPKSRVRLRKFTYQSPYDNEQNEMAVPEDSTYGKRFPNLVATVSGWARESQPEVKKMSEEGKYPEFSTFVRYGGSYADSRDGTILNGLLAPNAGDKPYYNHDDTEHNLDDEHDTVGEYEEAVDRLNTEASQFEHVHAYGEVDHDGDGGDPHVYWNADMQVLLSDEIIGEGFQDPEWSKLSEISSALTYGNYVGYLDISEVEILPADRGIFINIAFEAGSEYERNPDGFESFIGDLSALNDKYDEVKAGVIKILSSMKLIPPSKWQTYATEFEKREDEGEASYENLNVSIDDTDIDIASEKGHEHDVDISDYISVLSKSVELEQSALNRIARAAKGMDGGRETTEQEKINAASRIVYIMAKSPQVQAGAAVEIIEAARVQVKNQLSFPGMDETDVDTLLVPENFELYATLVSETRFADGGNIIKFGIGMTIKITDPEDEILIAKEFADWLDKNYYKAMKSVEKAFRKYVHLKMDNDEDLRKVTKKGMTETQKQIERVQRLVSESKRAIKIKFL